MSDDVKRPRGRPRLDPDGLVDAEQLRLPLPAGTKERMRAALREGESMTGMIREAVERELVRRERRA